jgi:hypothetical protein
MAHGRAPPAMEEPKNSFETVRKAFCGSLLPIASAFGGDHLDPDRGVKDVHLLPLSGYFTALRVLNAVSKNIPQVRRRKRVAAR